MIIVGVVGIVFAAIAVTGVWLDTQDEDDLREMGVVLGYKDEQAVIRSVVVAQQQHQQKRRTPKTTKRTTHARAYPAKVVHRVDYKPRAGGVH